MKKFWIFVIAVMVLLFIVACAPPAEEVELGAEKTAEKEVEKIVIGALIPLSGDAAEYGNPIRAAEEIALEEINNAGGIAGKKLEIIFEDGKCEAKAATTSAQKLVSVDRVKIILGGTCSSETLAAAPITEENKVILISSASSSPDITAAGDFVFRTYPSDAFSASVAAKFAKDRNFTKAAVISEQKDYTQALREVFKTSFTELGCEIVADETYSSEDTDFRTQVLKIKDGNPDLIYVAPQTPVKGTLAIKQLREAGLEQQLLTAEVLIGREVAKENAELFEGLIGLEPSFNESNTKAATLFRKYKEKYEQDPPMPFFMASAYDDVYLVVEAIEAVGMDTEKIRDYFYELKDWEGAVGKLTFDENGDPILKFAIKQVKSGEIIEIE